MKIFPSPQLKRFCSETGFTVNRPSDCHHIRRFPTLFCKGAGSEVTGVHGRKGYQDDPIGRNDVVDNQLAKKKDWFENTVIPVVDDTIHRVTGTPWSDWGMYADWWQDPDWHVLICPGSTKDAYVDDKLDLTNAVDWTQKKIVLNPDYTLKHPVYGLPNIPKDKAVRIKKLQVLKRQMKSNFGPQIMVDPSPPGDRLWDKETCEHFVPKHSGPGIPSWGGPGIIWVLSDPAPADTGRSGSIKQTARGDGSKDFWSIAVLKVRMHGERWQAILLWGERSKSWPTSQGLDLVVSLMQKFGTNRAINEAYGEMIGRRFRDMKDAVRRGGAQWLGRDPRTGKPLNYKESYVKGAKNTRFADLVEMAREGDFMIADSCPKSYLYGPENSRHMGFLSQSRDYVPIITSGKERNNLEYDDDVDTVSRITDPIIRELSPAHSAPARRFHEEDDDDIQTNRRSRYCSA